MTSRNFHPNDIITSSERERDRDPLRVIIDYIRTVVLRALFTRVGTTLLREAKEFAADMIATE